MTSSPRPQRVVAFGECMIELREDVGNALAYAFAGDTLNTATYLRRLLPEAGFAVDFATAVGDDPLSEQMLDGWRAQGIGTELVRSLCGELPGLYWIHTDDTGEREFYYWRSDSAARHVLDDNYAANIETALQTGDVLYLSGISIAILDNDRRNDLLQLVAALHSNGVKIAYDTNYRARLWRDAAQARFWHERLLESADLFITSFPDEVEMFGDRGIEIVADRIGALGIEEWVIRGDPGVTITRYEGRAEAQPVDRQKVVDTTGAGDSFDAGYLAARLSGYTTAESITAGHALAATVVQYSGAIIPADATPSLASIAQGITR